jgi:thiamine pyrophosphate-dependent acetolactate synthase large subunit-like protein
VAAALGGSGTTVRTVQQLKVALQKFVRRPGPTVIDIRITRNVLSIPYRRVWYGEDV